MEASTTESSPLSPAFKSKQPLLTTPLKTHHPPLLTPDPPPRSALHLRYPNLDAVSTFGKAKGSDIVSSVLPPMYEMLCEFFNAMVSSIRLLRLKRLPAILGQLRQNIESLTNRRFTLHHLAQLKHITPEVIVVKKIRVQDEVTSCMREELLISLEVDAAEIDNNLKGSGGFSHLKGLFRSRITAYVTTHPEGDVPGGELPELFYKPKEEPEPSMNGNPASRAVLLAAPTFKRRFSSKAFSAAAFDSSPSKPSACLPETPVKEATSALSKNVSISPTIDIEATPVKLGSTPTDCVSTPVEEVLSTPAKLMVATPSLRTPKRSLVTDDAADKINKSAKRRVRFEESSDDIDEQPNEVGGDKIDVVPHCSAALKDLREVLPTNVLHSFMDKERRTLEEQDPVVSEARRRQQLMAGVPKLFDMIQLLFQSIRRSVMTKEELIHKILAGHLDIVDSREVEHQLKLLQEVAPEFITEKSGLRGDALLRVNKFSCAVSIRARLLEAK